jgi:hypothetical protein
VSPGGTANDVLKQLFDAVVEVRRGDDGSEFRVRGGDFGPRSWTSVIRPSAVTVAVITTGPPGDRSNGAPRAAVPMAAATTTVTATRISVATMETVPRVTAQLDAASYKNPSSSVARARSVEVPPSSWSSPSV